MDIEQYVYCLDYVAFAKTSNKVQESWLPSYWSHLWLLLFSRKEARNLGGQSRISEATHPLWVSIACFRSFNGLLLAFSSDRSWARRGFWCHCRWLPKTHSSWYYLYIFLVIDTVSYKVFQVWLTGSILHSSRTSQLAVVSKGFLLIYILRQLPIPVST